MIPEELALYADYSLYRGLCCGTLYSSKLDGFPQNKFYGVSCSYLHDDHTCKIHHELKQKGMKGCLGHDYLGVGQSAVRKNVPADQDMLAVYRKLLFLHQVPWYLGEALLRRETAPLHGELQVLIQILDTVRRQSWRKALTADIDSLHGQTSRLLKKTIQQEQLQYSYPHKYLVGKRFTNKRLRSTDFSMKSLLAANLSGYDLQGSCFLGSDMRDYRIAGNDLRNCFFLTQTQPSITIGDSLTRLPNHLRIPAHRSAIS